MLTVLQALWQDSAQDRPLLWWNSHFNGESVLKKQLNKYMLKDSSWQCQMLLKIKQAYETMAVERTVSEGLGNVVMMLQRHEQSGRGRRVTI